MSSRAAGSCKQTVREKFTCRDCETISEPPAPFHVIPRGRIGASLLAMILFEKYGCHQPLNRQSERYAREGVDLDVSTMADHVGAGAAALAPLHELIRSHVLAAERLHGDDTTVPVLAKGKTITGRLWAYVRDDRPFGQGEAGRRRCSSTIPATAAASIPKRHLAGYAGILQADAYSGFGGLYAPTRAGGAVTEALCWAHARRGFFELADLARPARRRRHRWPSRRSARSTRSSPTSARSTAVRPSERLAYRREHVAPLVAAFEVWMQHRAPEALAPCRGRQSHGLHAQALARLHPLPRRRADLSHQQRRRTSAARCGLGQKLCTSSDYAQFAKGSACRADVPAISSTTNCA